MNRACSRGSRLSAGCCSARLLAPPWVQPEIRRETGNSREIARWTARRRVEAWLRDFDGADRVSAFRADLGDHGHEAARIFVRKTWVGPRTMLGGATSGWTGLVLRYRSPRRDGTLPDRYRGEDLVCEAWQAAAPATRQAPGVSRVPARSAGGPAMPASCSASGTRAPVGCCPPGRSGSGFARSSRRESRPPAYPASECPLFEDADGDPQTRLRDGLAQMKMPLGSSDDANLDPARVDARHALAFRGERSASTYLLAFCRRLR